MGLILHDLHVKLFGVKIRIRSCGTGFFAFLHIRMMGILGLVKVDECPAGLGN